MNVRAVVSNCSSTMSISIFTGSSSASIFAPSDKEARGGPAFEAHGIRSRRRQQVPRQLLLQKQIVRLVLVEAPYHVIAIPVRVPIDQVLIEPVGIRIPRHVQPVPPPSLAISGRSQQPVDDPRKRIRPRILQKLADLAGRGRQPRQVVARAADQRPFVGGRRRSEPFGLQRRQHKAVDRRLHPPGIPHLGKLAVRPAARRPSIFSAARRLGGLHRGQGAPISIHCAIAAISASLSLPEGGIFSASLCRTARSSRLSAGFPGTIAGPRVPPFRIASRLSSRRPPIGDVGEEWQADTAGPAPGARCFRRIPRHRQR